MTSPQARNAIVTSGLKKKHYLETTKDGVPLQNQVPITYEVYQGAGNETYTPIGANGLSVAGALAGPLTIDFRTNAPNYYLRQIYITIVGGVGQNVNLLLPLPPYNTIEFGTPNFINNYVIAPSANHQLIWLGFGDLGAGLVQLA
jgi:hypothetical protein